MEGPLMDRARPTRGFTLIEMLVVVVVVGVLASVVVVGFVGADKEQELKTEARRLALLIELARDEALQRNEEWGVFVEPDSYTFAIYDPALGKWSEQEDRRFRERQIDNMTLAIKAEKLVIPGQVEGQSIPQIVIFSSGEQTPFEIVLAPEWQTRAWRIESDGVSTTAIERGE